VTSTSIDEVKRVATDAIDWLWGMAQGSFNEKQTTSQIVVDAIIGMIPILGDATAVRDLIAVGTRLAEDPRKREEVMEWVLLVILIFALIPVAGGVIKGVGCLLLKAGKTAAENHKVLQEIVAFLNRVGHGNGLKFIKELDLLKYQSELIAKFNGFCDKLIEVMHTMKDKLGRFLSPEMKATMDLWATRFTQLKALGGKMIPRALKELNGKLKAVQHAIYQGEIHTAMPGVKNATREAEARLVEDMAPLPKSARNGFKANTLADYHHNDGWPDLSKNSKRENGKSIHPDIEAFSGGLNAIELKPGQTIYRVIMPGKNGQARPWWTHELPPNAEAWREEAAVLDNFNKNGHYIEFEIPKGTTLKAWEGKAAEQLNAATGQYLPGGGVQLFVELPHDIAAAMDRLVPKSTGWGETLNLYGFEHARNAAASACTEKLGTNEIQSKKSVAKTD